MIGPNALSHQTYYFKSTSITLFLGVFAVWRDFLDFFKFKPTTNSFRKTPKTALPTPSEFPDHADVEYSIPSKINKLQAFFQPSPTPPLANFKRIVDSALPCGKTVIRFGTKP